jgi:hypothetical protein
MADIRINQLPAETNPVASENVAIDGASTRRTTIQELVDAGAPVASQAEAEAGIDASKRMTPLTTKQAIAANVGTTVGTIAAGDDSRIVNAVQTSRTLTAGTGLTGGGDLSANRSVALNPASIASLALADTAVQPARLISAGTGLTGGGSLAADRTVSLSAGSIASLALADTSVQPNGSSGVSRSSTAAGEGIDPGHFGGKFLDGKASNKLRIDNPSATDSSDGPRFVLSLEHIFPGGTDNTPSGDDDGPDDCRGGLWVMSTLEDWLTNTNYGEPNGAYILSQGGLNSDTGGMLIGAYKVFDDAGGTGSGSITAIEASASRVTSAGTETSRMQAIVGFQEGAGGALNKHGAGFFTRNEVDANNQAFVAVNGAAAFKYAFAAYTAQNPDAMYFAALWNGNSVIQLGQTAANKKIVHNTATDALLIQNTAGTINIASLTDAGVFAAYAGVTVSNGSDTITKTYRRVYNIDLGVIAAGATVSSDVTLTGVAADDFVGASWGNDYADDKVIISAVRVLGANQVRIHFRNVGSVATADLPSQKVILAIIR